MKQFFFIAVVAFFTFACNSTKGVVVKPIPEPEPEPTGVQFTDSDKLMDVLEIAKASNKLVFVDFYTTWCLPCKLMDEDVFSDEEFAIYMNDNFINFKVNAEKGNGANLALLYQIAAYPTLLFLDEEGNILVQKIGAAYQTELRKMGEEAKRLVVAN